MKTTTPAALENLRAAALRLENEELNIGSIGNEIALLASNLVSLTHTPPTMRTKDFKYPIGDPAEMVPVETPNSVLERLIDESDLLPVWFLEKGATVQRSVARVVLTKAHTVNGSTFPPGIGWATGFMVSPTLFLTNNHVIPNENFAKKIRIQFNFQLGPDGIEQGTESFLPAQNDVFRTNAALDYTVIRLRPNQAGPSGDETVFPGQRWGTIPLNENPVFRMKQHLNIIQHPSGRRKEVALQDNEIDALFQNAVRYRSDTEPGSSGSPVLDNLWQLVALHHAGGERDSQGKWINNEGIRIDSIIQDIRQNFEAQDNTAMLNELGL